MVYIQNLEMKYSPCMSSTFKQIFNLIGKEKLFKKVETVVKHSFPHRKLNQWNWFTPYENTGMLSQYSEYNAIAMLRITKQLEENCESSILNTFT